MLNTNLVFKWGTRLLERFPNQLSELFTPEVNLTALGLKPEEIHRFKQADWQAVDALVDWQDESKQQYLVTIQDPAYPPSLREIAHPPLLLFVLGSLERLNNLQLAIVGSRKPTFTGLKIAQNFAQELSGCGITITSGFALGIDSASHRGGLAQAGKTIAVMGSGFNHLYPVSNRALSEEILAQDGTLISEFPLNCPAAAWHFPLRNRIISGLSLGTLVIEAHRKSGSLITARLANEQGREVFAIPGSIYNQKASGTNYLIKQGAKLVTDLMDILEEFPMLQLNDAAGLPSARTVEAKNKLDSRHSKLLDCVKFELTTREEIVEQSGLALLEVSEGLLELELEGRVEEVMGCYVRTT